MDITLPNHFTSENVSGILSAVTICWVAMSYSQVENNRYNVLEKRGGKTVV
jgi:hypothetical protein